MLFFLLLRHLLLIPPSTRAEQWSEYASNRCRSRQTHRRTLLPLPRDSVHSRYRQTSSWSFLLNKLPEDAELTLDSVALGDNSLELTCFVDVARERGLGIVEPALELRENGYGE